MRAQSTSTQPAAGRARPPRRVVLEYIVRRDATQRLSVALALLARASGADHGPARGEWKPETAAVGRRPPTMQEEDRS